MLNRRNYYSSGAAPSAGGGGSPGAFPSLSWAFSRWVADDAANTVETVDQTFATTDVDTGASKITLSPDPGYLVAPAYPSIAATRVYFSSTGTLPSGLTAGAPYYLSPASGGGYDIYPEADASSYAGQQNGLVEETPMPAQNYAQLANKVTLSTQGTGTHRVYSNPLLKVMSDKYGTGYLIQSTSTNKHARWELVTGSGVTQKAILSRILARDHADNGSYNLYGFRMDPSPSGLRTTWQANLRSKRSCLLWTVWRSDESDTQGVAKAPVSPSGVNTTTGVITTSESGGHGFTTAWLVRVRVYPGGGLPTGLSGATDYYVRSVSATTMTLHPTAGDASGDTNVVIPSTQGSVGFTVVAVQRPGDQERTRGIAEVREPSTGDNTISTRSSSQPFGDNTLQLATDFSTGASSVNCRVGAVGRGINTMTPDNATVRKVRMWMPPASVGPTRSDTGLALANGEYWITREPGSTVYTRLFLTEADADASVGVANASLVNVLRWTAAGDGFVRFEQSDYRPFGVSTESGTDTNAGWSPPVGEPGALIVLADYDDPAASFIHIKMWWNGALVADYEITSGTKGVTNSATSAGDSGLTLLNSPQGHIPGEGLMWEIGLGSSTGAIDEGEIATLSTWLQANYGI